MKETRTTAAQKKRAAYRERRQAQLQEWSARLDLFRARARKNRAEVKVRYREQLEGLQHALDAMRSRLRVKGGDRRA